MLTQHEWHYATNYIIVTNWSYNINSLLFYFPPFQNVFCILTVYIVYSILFCFVIFELYILYFKKYYDVYYHCM